MGGGVSRDNMLCFMNNTHADAHTDTDTDTDTHTRVLGQYQKLFRNWQVGVSVIIDCSTYCIHPKNLE